MFNLLDLFDKNITVLKKSGAWDDETASNYKKAKAGDPAAALSLAEKLADIGQVKESLRWLSQSAEAGYAEAEYKLGEYIAKNGRIDLESEKGYYISYNDPAIWLKRASEHGNTEAAFKLAELYVGTDDEEAVKWYRESDGMNGKCDHEFVARKLLEAGDEDNALIYFMKSADSGSRDSAYTAGKMLADAEIYEDAVKYLKMSEHNDKESAFYFGICHANLGRDEEALADLKKSEELFGYLDPANVDKTYELLGDMYYFGKGTEPSVKDAVDCYKKVVNFSSEESKERFADCLFKGTGTQKDTAAAARLGHPDALYELYRSDPKINKACLEKAALHGQPEAMYELGKTLYEEEKYDSALLRLLPVRDLHDDVSFMLGICLANTGKYREALAYLTEAAASGNSEAEYLVGRFHLNGIGTSKNEKRAVEWFRRSSENENPTGSYELGMCLKYGIGTFKDIDEGMALILKSAESGCAQAIYEMGNSFRLGNGIAQNKKKAIECYRASAELGYVPAIYQYGFLYELGYITGQRDPEQALEQYRKCRRNYKDVEDRISSCIRELG